MILTYLLIIVMNKLTLLLCVLFTLICSKRSTRKALDSDNCQLGSTWPSWGRSWRCDIWSKIQIGRTWRRRSSPAAHPLWALSGWRMPDALEKSECDCKALLYVSVPHWQERKETIQISTSGEYTPHLQGTSWQNCVRTCGILLLVIAIELEG